MAVNQGGAKILWADVSADFASVTSASGLDSSAIALTGASPGDPVWVGDTLQSTANSAQSGIVFTGYVAAADSVKIRAHNYTAANVDPTSRSFKVAVIKLLDLP